MRPVIVLAELEVEREAGYPARFVVFLTCNHANPNLALRRQRCSRPASTSTFTSPDGHKATRPNGIQRLVSPTLIDSDPFIDSPSGQQGHLFRQLTEKPANQPTRFSL